jgi:hypothetical protein
MVWLPEWVDARTPDEVVNRRPLPLCGVEEAPVPRPGEFFDATVRNCFWAAKLDGRDAEFVSVQPTMEGDRIATIYCLGSDGRVDVFIDSTGTASVVVAGRSRRAYDSPQSPVIGCSWSTAAKSLARYSATSVPAAAIELQAATRASLAVADSRSVEAGGASIRRSSTWASMPTRSGSTRPSPSPTPIRTRR